MDLWLQYVIPANAIAARIVGIIIGLFALWVCLVAYRWRHTATLVEVLRRCSELNRLVEARHAFLEIRDSGNAAKAQSVADSLFDDFCRDVRLPANDVLTLHLRTIFDAGLHDSRLEVGQLLRHTSGRVLQPNSMLRSMLTTFVLLGLLGTLFGLADSLSRLSPMGVGLLSTRDVSTGLGHLLGDLRSAFAPSIVGVACTVLGIAMFSVYQHFACGPLVELLESKTLAAFVPRLYPTVTQRLEKSLALTEGQLQKSLKTAQDVAELASALQGDASDLSQRIREAQQPLQELKKTSDTLGAFGKDFVGAAQKVTSFQSELQQLYQHMVTNAGAFQQAVTQGVAENKQLQEELREILKYQSSSLASTVALLQQQQEHLRRQGDDTQSGLQQMLAASTTAIEGIKDRNREVAVAVVGPLKEELQRMIAQLYALQERIQKMDAPLTQAASTIEGALETVVVRTETLVRELQREVLRQNETGQQHITAANGVIAELMKDLKDAGAKQAGDFARATSHLADSAAIIGKAATAFASAAKGERASARRRAAAQGCVAELADVDMSPPRKPGLIARLRDVLGVP